MTPITLCRGRRELSGGMVGICVVCARRTSSAPKGAPVTHLDPPPAARNDTGKWSCAQMVAPAGWPA